MSHKNRLVNVDIDCESLFHLNILILYDNDDLVISITVIHLKCANVSNKKVAYLTFIKKNKSDKISKSL